MIEDNKNLNLNKNLYLASPRGFCAGVERAIKIVEQAIKIHGKPVYVKHEIVHNKHVVKRLSEDGAIFVESFENVPKNSIVIFSAHGVAKKVVNEAKEYDLNIFDATLYQKVCCQTFQYVQKIFCFDRNLNFSLLTHFYQL